MGIPVDLTANWHDPARWSVIEPGFAHPQPALDAISIDPRNSPGALTRAEQSPSWPDSRQ